MFNGRPFQTGYFYSSKHAHRIKLILKESKPKHIVSQLIRVTEYTKDYHLCPKTLDYMDALSKGMERRISRAPMFLKWLYRSEANRLKLYERRVFDYFEFHTIISNQDKDYILHPDRNKILCVPNGVDDSFFEKSAIRPDKDLVFVGNMSYSPNVEAVQYIAQEILPVLRRRNINPSLVISGANPNQTVLKLGKTDENIEITGWVDDIRKSYKRGKIFLAPMMIGTGMQNKLLEAMALGTPCITTPLANNAIHAKNGESILVANSPEEFVNHIDKLLGDSNFYEKISKSGRDFVRSNYSWKNSTELIIKLINQH